jgi:hypothetical protein
LTLFVSLFCSTHPADKRAKHNAIMIIHFMPELKLLKEYNSFSHDCCFLIVTLNAKKIFDKYQKYALSESSQSNI